MATAFHGKAPMGGVYHRSHSQEHLYNNNVYQEDVGIKTKFGIKSSLRKIELYNNYILIVKSAVRREHLMRSYADKYKNNGSLTRSYQVNSLGSSSDRESPHRVPRVLDEDTKFYIERAEKYKRKNAELRSRLTIAETEV